ncbi:hypothetical protein NDU88_009804 [Pleurodeles waltl]|uniref:Uncharacterized protein n=1 Tax=Pleurodeles waltl TaxID=8319 RepID=A0AAV7PW01_PLEWA|nr:hypothetical protein NDU88_009804 [Pleurodeles waltl]
MLKTGAVRARPLELATDGACKMYTIKHSTASTFDYYLCSRNLQLKGYGNIQNGFSDHALVKMEDSGIKIEKVGGPSVESKEEWCKDVFFRDCT